MSQAVRENPGVAPLIAAVVAPDERPRIEAAGSGWFSIVHRETIWDAIRAVRERPIDAVLLSVRHCRGPHLAALNDLVRDFPGVATVALVSQADPDGSETLLHLGASGVRQVVDVTTPTGWQRLRQLLGHPATRDVARIQGPIIRALGEVPPDTRIFFEALIRLAPEIFTSRDLARRLDIRGTTLMSRFQRARLPSPKSYLAGMRLVHATLLFERPGYTLSDVAYRMEYSSPQSFGRHVRALFGISSSEFRRRFPFQRALGRFIDVMVLPYEEVWRGFRPLGKTKADKEGAVG